MGEQKIFVVCIRSTNLGIILHRYNYQLNQDFLEQGIEQNHKLQVLHLRLKDYACKYTSPL